MLNVSPEEGAAAFVAEISLPTKKGENLTQLRVKNKTVSFNHLLVRTTRAIEGRGAVGQKRGRSNMASGREKNGDCAEHPGICPDRWYTTPPSLRLVVERAPVTKESKNSSK